MAQCTTIPNETRRINNSHRSVAADSRDILCRERSSHAPLQPNNSKSTNRHSVSIDYQDIQRCSTAGECAVEYRGPAEKFRAPPHPTHRPTTLVPDAGPGIS